MVETYRKLRDTIQRFDSMIGQILMNFDSFRQIFSLKARNNIWPREQNLIVFLIVIHVPINVRNCKVKPYLWEQIKTFTTAKQPSELFERRSDIIVQAKKWSDWNGIFHFDLLLIEVSYASKFSTLGLLVAKEKG